MSYKIIADFIINYIPLGYMVRYQVNPNKVSLSSIILLSYFSVYYFKNIKSNSMSTVLAVIFWLSFSMMFCKTQFKIVTSSFFKFLLPFSLMS